MSRLDYTARIKQLNALKSSINSNQINSTDVTSFSETIGNWKGGSSQDGFYDLVQDTKSTVTTITDAKSGVLQAIDTRITSLEGQIETQYNNYLGTVTRKYDDDPAENRRLKRAALNRLSFLDSTVKSRLGRHI